MSLTSQLSEIIRVLFFGFHDIGKKFSGEIFASFSLLKLLKEACSFFRSFSSDTHREKTSEWRKTIKCVDICI